LFFCCNKSLHASCLGTIKAVSAAIVNKQLHCRKNSGERVKQTVSPSSPLHYSIHHAEWQYKNLHSGKKIFSTKTSDSCIEKEAVWNRLSAILIKGCSQSKEEL
jgi:hypothetical protein